MTEKGTPSHPAQADGSAPFLLLAKCDATLFDDGVFEPFLRRIGLGPGEATAPAVASSLFADACLEVRFAEQRALVGRISDEILKTAAHPDRSLRATEVLACSPVGAWSGCKVADSRELFKLMLLLIDLTQADQIYWSPAGLWSDAWAFRAAVTEMLASGMPPVLHLVAFDRTGPGGAMRSRGLAFFAVQELEVRDDGGLPDRELLRRLARLAVDAMVNGAISARRTFPGLSVGERIQVVPEIGAGGTATLFVTVLQE